MNRVRLICCSSTSAWAKSVLYVKSAVSVFVSPYFASKPKSRPKVVSDPGGNGIVLESAATYGLISRFSERETAGADDDRE